MKQKRNLADTFYGNLSKFGIKPNNLQLNTLPNQNAPLGKVFWLTTRETEQLFVLFSESNFAIKVMLRLLQSIYRFVWNKSGTLFWRKEKLENSFRVVEFYPWKSISNKFFNIPIDSFNRAMILWNKLISFLWILVLQYVR